MTRRGDLNPSRTLCPDCAFDVPSPEALKGPYGALWTAQHRARCLEWHWTNGATYRATGAKVSLHDTLDAYRTLTKELEAQANDLKRDLFDERDQNREQLGYIEWLEDDIRKVRDELAQVRGELNEALGRLNDIRAGAM